MDIESLSKIRKQWLDWWPAFVSIGVLLSGLIAGTAVVTRRLSTLDTVAKDFDEQKVSLDALQESVSKLDRSLASLAGDKTLETLKDVQLRFSSDIKVDLQRLSSKVEGFETRLAILEALAKVHSAGTVAGRIKTPQGEKVYGPDKLDDFRRDAEEIIQSGRNFKARFMSFDPDSLTCILGGGGCTDISFVDRDNDTLAYTIEHRSVTNEKYSAAVRNLQALQTVASIFDQCDPANPSATPGVNRAVRGRRR